MSNPSSTYTQPRRPMAVNLLNWAGEKLNLDSLPWLELTTQSLVTAAESQSGLSDWGDDYFRQPLEKVVEALNREANLNLVGRYFFRQYLTRLLVNRLQLQDAWQQNPEILEIPVEKPLFVVGLFRSGTTFLHNLLSCDPHSRWLHVAEALQPTPPPQKDTWENDSRIQEVEKIIKFENSLTENFSTAHYINVNRPAECSRIFEYGMVAHLFDFRAQVNSYSQWLQGQDLTPAYEYYRQQLQYLSWHWSEQHWVMKAPAHLFALDALLKVFPDACIVHIHRDPLKVLPSCCSLSAMGRSRFTDKVDMDAIGIHWLDELARMTELAMDFRATATPERFYDVHYLDFIKNPLGKVREIYDYFGYGCTPQMEANMEQWYNNNRQHKRGVHRYSLEQFGLDAGEVRERFAKYYETFSLIREN